MMSKSSRGASAVLALAPLARSHANLHVSIAYIASLDDNGTFHSLHGEPEVVGDVWELCAIEHYQANLKYLNFLVCLSQQYTVIPDNAEKCAIEAALDLSVMKECVESKEGTYLLNRSIQLSSAEGLNGEVESVIFINGKRYAGPLSQMAVEEAICATNAVLDDDEIYEKWWFYFLVALGVVGGVAILVAGLLTAYRVYVKCNRASDMWLNMIKSNPGNALDFADKVQDAMHRYENHLDGGGGGGYGGPGAGVGGGSRGAGRERGMEEGYAGAAYVRAAYSVNSAQQQQQQHVESSPDAFEDSPGGDAHYYAEESPLLSSLGTTWSMGGVRD